MNRFAIEEDDQFEIHVKDYADEYIDEKEFYNAAEEVMRKTHQGSVYYRLEIENYSMRRKIKYERLISPNSRQYCSQSTPFYFSLLLFFIGNGKGDQNSIREVWLYISDIIIHWHDQTKLHHQGKIPKNV